MKTRMSAAPILSGVLLAALLAACSDEPVAKPSATAPAPTAAAASASGVSLDPRYEATPAQGIDFTRPGYPSFVKEAHGLAGHEPWGRWTDANLAPTARLRLASALPKSFKLELKAHGLGPNAYQPVKIRAGSVEHSIVLGNPPKDSYQVEFTGVEGDTIEIVPPAPILPGEVTPGNPDTRKLGVGLVSIKILD